jgi:NADP+-dependent farnesol dehydrogenase
MKEHDIDGHIVHLNSIAGHVVHNVPSFSVYPASKFAVTALTESLRLELVQQKSRIKVTVSNNPKKNLLISLIV